MPASSRPTALRIDGRGPRVVLAVSVDWFVASHRMPIARALRDAGCEVVIAAQETDARHLIEREGFTFHPLPLDRGGRDPLVEVRALAALAKLYRDFRPDIVHQVSIKPVIYGTLAARALGIRRIINAVSGLGFAFIDRADEPVAHRVLRGALRRAYRTALSGRDTRVIFQNDDDARALMSASGLASGRVRMIRGSGVDLARFTVTPLPIADEPVVLLPARPLWDKGVGEFVEAARILRAEGVKARFVLVGRIDQENPAGVPEATIRGWISAGLVEWMGSIPHADMPRCYAQAHLVVLPSYREGLPLVLVEAGAAGRAAVATDVPGCRDVIRPGDTGWLVPGRDGVALASAIREALADSTELTRRGRLARERVEREFGVDAVVRDTMRIYEELLDAPGD